jgi:hypothetical protein
MNNESLGLIAFGVLFLVLFLIYRRVINSSPDEENKEISTVNKAQKERRFLIIWIGVCLFAFFVNAASINGDVADPGSKTVVNLWTTDMDQKDFWPFTSYTKYYSVGYPKQGVVDRGYGLNLSQLDVYEGTHFYGIFKSFNFPELIVYSLIGFAIIYIPKIW